MLRVVPLAGGEEGEEAGVEDAVDHALQLQGMLVGGVRVLGLYRYAQEGAQVVRSTPKTPARPAARAHPSVAAPRAARRRSPPRRPQRSHRSAAAATQLGALRATASAVAAALQQDYGAGAKQPAAWLLLHVPLGARKFLARSFDAQPGKGAAALVPAEWRGVCRTSAAGKPIGKQAKAGKGDVVLRAFCADVAVQLRLPLPATAAGLGAAEALAAARAVLQARQAPPPSARSARRRIAAHEP